MLMMTEAEKQAVEEAKRLLGSFARTGLTPYDVGEFLRPSEDTIIAALAIISAKPYIPEEVKVTLAFTFGAWLALQANKRGGE